MKRLLALLLVMTLVLCLVPIVALAEDEAPRFTVTPDKTVLRPGDTVTFTVTSNIQESLVYFNFALGYQAKIDGQYIDGSQYLEYVSGELLGDGMQAFKHAFVRRSVNGNSVRYETETAAWGYEAQTQSDWTPHVPPSQVCTMTFRVMDDVQGTVTAPIYVCSWAKARYAGTGSEKIHQDQGDIYLMIIGSGVQAEGDYSVSLEQPAPVSVGETVQVPVNITSGNAGITSYNAFDMSFSYDPAVLTAVTDGYGENITATAANGVLRVRRYGAAEDLGKAFDLSFTAKAQGTTNVSITDARVDMKENAADYDAPQAEWITPATTVTIHSNTTYDVAWAGNASDDVAGKPTTAYADEDFIFTVNKTAGYTYTISALMGGAAAEVVDNQDGTYTVANVSGNLEITVNKTVSGEVSADLYLHMNSKDIFLVTVTGNPGEGNIYRYDGAAMFKALNYDSTGNVWSYLVIVDSGETAPTGASAKEVISIAAGSPEATIPAGYDVNKTNTVDINDAQLCYDLYMAKYSDFSQVSMEKFLRADVNGTKVLDSDDAVTLVSMIV